MSPSPDDAVRHFRARFEAGGAPARAVSEKTYMKSALRFHGVDAKQIHAECASFCKEHRDLDRESLRAVVSALYATDWFDLRTAGIALLERKVRLLEASDAAWLVDLARASPCWAHVDFLSTKVIDPLIQANPRLLGKMRVWAKDRDFWVRRVALLGQLGPLRRGAGDFALFAAIAGPMLDEKEFFIQKAIGWVLREVSKKRPALVRDFLVPHAARASTVTWREATKYLPAAMKREVERARLFGRGL